MRKTITGFLSLILVTVIAFGLTACFGDSGFYLESTTAKETSATTAYKRSFFDMTTNPYYSFLSENEKNAYSLIYETLSAGKEKVECKFDLSADELSKAIDSVLNDHPELFWLDNKYAYTYDPSDGSVKEITFNFYDFAGTPTKLVDAKVKFEKAADAVLSEARYKPTMVERELYIHDYICKNTEYDESAPYNQSAYSALVLHKSVCAGYARCFQYLAKKAGITCFYVTGRTEGLKGQVVNGSSEGGSHSWNIVLLDGSYYNVDCLWDDTASETYGSMIYPFFNLTDDSFIYHARIEMAKKLPICTGTKYKYSNYFGQTIEANNIVFVDAA